MSFGGIEGFAPGPGVSAEMKHWFAQIRAELTDISATSSVSSVSGNTTLDETHGFVAVDAVGGAITITLPPIADIKGREYTVKKIDSSANNVTIDGNGSETIDGNLTAVITAQWTSVTVVATSTGWLIK